MSGAHIDLNGGDDQRGHGQGGVALGSHGDKLIFADFISYMDIGLPLLANGAFPMIVATAGTIVMAGKYPDIVLFDVREESEYAVSHLTNAIRVDPDIGVEDFRSTFASDLVNKTVVFYCSVGRRSSELAEKVGEDLMSTGSKQVLNLEHGIFGWHNESRRLMSGEQPTDYVHPYSWRWDDLIARRSLIRYKPE